jgi:hypothetical protein
MARPSNRDLLALYRAELERSKKWREKENHEDLWRRMVDLYHGKHLKNMEIPDEDRIVINVAKATIDVIGPSIAVNNPKITINARQPEFADRAITTEFVTNYVWRQGKFQLEIRSAVNDMLIMGHGWTKIGWHYKPKKLPDATVASDEQLESESVPATDDEAEEYRAAPETTAVISEDRPFVERVSPFHVFVDPDAAGPPQLRWIAQRIRRPLNDVKNDTCYLSAARKEAKPSSRDPWEKSENGEDHKGEVPGGYVDLYEFYDLKSEKVCTFTLEGDGGFLIKPTPIPNAWVGNPFVMFRNYEVPDTFYPMGELEAIEVLQYELNETRSQIINHRRKGQPKWLYHRASFKDDGVDELRSTAYNTMVPVDSDRPMGDVVIPMPTTVVPPEFYNMSEMIKSDMDQISGVSDYMRGQMPEIRRTATEAAMLEHTLAMVAERVVQIMQTYMTGKQVLRVVGPNGLKAWATYDRDHIQGSYDFEVEAGSTQPKNESFRRQSALQMMDALGPLAPSGVIKLEKLVTQVLQGFGVNNAADFIATPPPQPELEPGAEGPPMEPQMLGAAPMQAPAPPPGMQMGMPPEQPF